MRLTTQCVCQWLMPHVHSQTPPALPGMSWSAQPMMRPVRGLAVRRSITLGRLPRPGP